MLSVSTPQNGLRMIPVDTIGIRDTEILRDAIFAFQKISLPSDDLGVPLLARPLKPKEHFFEIFSWPRPAHRTEFS
jgi:hypothetical protein